MGGISGPQRVHLTPVLRAVPDADGGRASRGRVPMPLTALFGREQEAALAVSLLRRDDVRLLTLTGPGGVGKTRLALQVAADLQDAFADGVAFVDLAPIAGPDLVASTIAHALGVRTAGNASIAERLRTYLHPKQHLLVLDNFEHVLEAGPLVVDLLSSCPELKVL